MYTAYVLTDEARASLELKFPPIYSKYVGHHVTFEFGVADTELPPEAIIKVLGKKDSTDGIEALVVSVDGNRKRPDGGIFHITWSFDPNKYKPFHSNEMLASAYSKYTLSLPIVVDVIPSLLK